MTQNRPEARLGDVLRERGETLAVAESATGGLICSLLTDVPGSSDYFDRGFVTYAYTAKTGTLGIDREILDAHGAVSEPVAAGMARAARDRAETTWGLGLTGIAGPSGGVEDKPVGTVYIGVAHAAPWGSGRSYATVSHHQFTGERTTIKRRAAEQAISMVLDEVGDA